MSVGRQSEADAYPDTCAVCGRSLAWPKELDENLSPSQIYRRHRRKHYSWSGEGEYDPDDDPYLSKNVGADVEEEDLDEDCKVDTQFFEVEIYYEMRETVTVEAANAREAKDLADEKRRYDGEPLGVMHRETIEYGEPSQASLEYLERAGLLPSDHDVTEEDIQELVSDEEERSENERQSEEVR